MKFIILFCTPLFLFSCSDNEQEDKITFHEDIHNAMDTIVAKLDYKPLTTKQVLTSIHHLIHGKVEINIHDSFFTDTSNVKHFVEELAVATTYSQWSTSLNLRELKDTSLIRAYNAAEILGVYSDSIPLESMNIDTLVLRTKLYFENESISYLEAYFLAVSCLENLSLSLDVSKNIKNRREYNSVIRQQLLRAEDLMNYLFDYQDYKPVSDFSLQFISILEYKNKEIDVKKLSELITAMKSQIYGYE